MGKDAGMNRSECNLMLEAFEGTFAKRYSQATKDRVFERCQAVPSNLTEAITERIEAADKHPDNIGNAILRAWHALDASAGCDDDSKGCPDCDGDGAITGYRKDPKTGLVSVHMALCAHCYPGTPYSRTKLQMQALGYMVCPSSDRATQDRWWRACQRNTAEYAKARGAMGGNMRPGDLLSDFDAMARGTSEDKRSQPQMYGEQRL